jgi:PHD-zinc-finger like domain
VCYGSDGALKKIGENELIHVYCGLMHNDIEVVSYYPSITFKKSMHYEETHHNCEICYNKNAHENCAEESCRRKVHVYCAKKNYVTLSKEVEEPKGWNHKMSIGNHGNFDLSD